MPKRKTIPFTQKDIKSRLRYEDGKMYWLARNNSRFDKQFAGKEAGSFNEGLQGFSVAFNGTRILLHRAVWVFHYGEIPEGMEIDHINQNRLDNRIENLRLSYRHQNAWNTKLRCNNQTGVKGVCWNPLTKTWRARINVNKKCVTIGSFVSFEEAKKATENARLDMHGEFANLGHQGNEVMLCR
jgi:hypothetical protein